MANLGFTEIMLILLVVLLLFGAKRIPEIAGSMGKGIREFKRSISEVERQVVEPERPANRFPADQARDHAAASPPPANDDDRPEPRRLLS